MIINRFDKLLDITFQWKEIPAFEDSQAKMFTFTEVSTRNSWQSRSSVGFHFAEIPPHGAIVMLVKEDNQATEAVGSSDIVEWAEVGWTEIHGETELIVE